MTIGWQLDIERDIEFDVAPLNSSIFKSICRLTILTRWFVIFVRGNWPMLKQSPFFWPSTKEKSNSLASVDWHRWSWTTSIEHRGVSEAPRCARLCWTLQHGVVVTVSFVPWRQLGQIPLREKLICRFGRNSHGLMQHGWPEQLFAYENMCQKMPHVFVGRKHLRSFHLAVMFVVLVARGASFKISTLVGCRNWFAHDVIWHSKIIPWNSWRNVAASSAVTGHLPGYLNRTVKVVTVAVAWTLPKLPSASTVDGHLQSHESDGKSDGSPGSSGSSRVSIGWDRRDLVTLRRALHRWDRRGIRGSGNGRCRVWSVGKNFQRIWRSRDSEMLGGNLRWQFCRGMCSLATIFPIFLIKESMKKPSAMILSSILISELEARGPWFKLESSVCNIRSRQSRCFNMFPQLHWWPVKESYGTHETSALDFKMTLNWLGQFDLKGARPAG